MTMLFILWGLCPTEIQLVSVDYPDSSPQVWRSSNLQIFLPLVYIVDLTRSMVWKCQCWVSLLCWNFDRINVFLYQTFLHILRTCIHLPHFHTFSSTIHPLKLLSLNPPWEAGMHCYKQIYFWNVEDHILWVEGICLDANNLLQQF